MTPNLPLLWLGRRLRLGVIGGGPGSFIGAVHRQAARLDDRYELVAAALSSQPDTGRQAGQALGLPPDRCYASGAALIAGEAQHNEGAEVIAIMTPNDTHFPLAMQALDAGMDVICDKPLTTTLADAQTLHARVHSSGRVLCLTHNYSGYPLVRQAKAMVMQGMLGEIRLLQVEYVQGGRARPGPGRTAWKIDPARSGESLVLGDIGTHAHQLLRFISGLEVTQIAAELGSSVPQRQFHDFACAMLRMDNGARASFYATQAAAGVENGLRIRVSGALGSLEWQQELPQQLHFKPLDAPAQIYTPNGPGTLPLARRASRIAAGHPEGFPDAFANLYTDAADTIAALRSGHTPDPLALFFPNADDGLQGARFMHAALASHHQNGAWVSV